jgi:glycosyltransferase involved in cell wall biosynthesis
MTIQQSNKAPDLSLVLACYDEEQILERSVKEIFHVLDAIQWTSEVIFVEDASCDQTSALIDRILRQNPGRALRKLTHIKNVGRGGTVSDGMRAANGRLVGFIDIDLEVSPRYILPCLIALEQGYDVATARRVYQFDLRSVHRQLMSLSYRTLVRWWLDTPLQDTETGYKFFRRQSILPLLDQIVDRRWFWDTEIMLRAQLAGLTIIEIPALHERSRNKTSTVKLFRDSLRHIRNLYRFRSIVRKLKKKPAP